MAPTLQRAPGVLAASAPVDFAPAQRCSTRTLANVNYSSQAVGFWDEGVWWADDAFYGETAYCGTASGYGQVPRSIGIATVLRTGACCLTAAHGLSEPCWCGSVR